MSGHVSNGEVLLPVNGVELCVETFGSSGDPAILLVPGAAASMLWWEADLCERIAAHGRFVVRYDPRDTGRSTSYPPGEPGYALSDLVADTLGVLDARGVGRAHVVCQSMFGGIGLALGAEHADRVASLTFVSTSTGEPGLPPPSDSLGENTPAAPDLTQPSSVVDYVVAGARAYSGGPDHFDEAAVRALVAHDVARSRDYAATLANHYAIDLDGPGPDRFGDITVPVLVVHGDRDPVFPLPHAEALHRAMPGSELLILPGVGHDVPRPAWDAFVSALARHTAA
ncbi:alpha/beta hydrolase [Actinoplanes sp. NPDC024001]|uniref:alpha/beta fold hydrolase n=1 Tax=Actinoplanes sp. NPDC024001 TaxID=3154598 RepID=UPI0033DF9E8C